VGESAAFPSAETLLVDRAYMLELTAKELTLLVGGLRVLGANTGGVQHGVSTNRPGVLSQDFFRNLLDIGVEWSTSADEDGVYEGRDADGNLVRTATAVDLVFGSNSILRGIVEVVLRRRREGEVRARLRQGVGQGHEPGPVRSSVTARRLSHHERTSGSGVIHSAAMIAGSPRRLRSAETG
jgi:hypothetical protein